jgi:LPS-assembly protein
MEGDAHVIGSGAVITGQAITMDFKTRTYSIKQHRAILHPELLGGNASGDVFLKAERGTGSESLIRTFDGSLTTCELDVPHYRIDGRDITVRPEKRIILRDTRFRILGRTWLRIPYLAIPLDTRRDRYTPQVGQTRDEGFFIKTLWGVPLEGERDLDINVDYFSKLGTGLGGRYRFAGEANQGFLKAYSILGVDPTLEVVGGYRQFFGANLLSLESNYQQRNYLNAPDNTFWTSRASLQLPSGQNNSRLSFYRSSNEASTSKTVSQTLGFIDDRRFGKQTRWNLGINWVQNRSDFASSSSIKREQVEISFRGSHDIKKAVAELEYQRTIPVGDTSNFFSSADRTPVLTVKTDSTRLFGSNFAKNLPFSTQLSIGEFANSATSSHIGRAHFDININKPERTNSAQSFGGNLRFRQSIYSDNTAQYSAIVNTSYRQAISSLSAFTLRYNYSKPTGFTPLTFDRLGQSNVATADLSIRPNQQFSIGMQTGYDFRFRENSSDTAWQQVGVRTEYRPSESVLARGLSTYDPNLRKWSNTRIDISIDKGDTFFGIGARYDGIRSTWSNLNIFVDGLKIGKVTASALLNYNGYTKQFDTKQVSLIYDMHCTEAILQILESNVGFRPGRQVYFFLRIKALPFSTPFGTGTQGQPIGIGTGFGN